MAIAVIKFKTASATEKSQCQYYDQLKKNKEKTHYVIVDGRMAPWLARAGIFNRKVWVRALAGDISLASIM